MADKNSLVSTTANLSEILLKLFSKGYFVNIGGMDVLMDFTNFLQSDFNNFKFSLFLDLSCARNSKKYFENIFYFALWCFEVGTKLFRFFFKFFSGDFEMK